MAHQFPEADWTQEQYVSRCPCRFEHGASHPSNSVCVEQECAHRCLIPPTAHPNTRTVISARSPSSRKFLNGTKTINDILCAAYAGSGATEVVGSRVG